MDVLRAVVLGIVQGLTEFLPVSSTAHLRIVPEFLGWGDPGAAYTAVIQIGTMLAVLVYFFGDLRRIATTWVRSLVTPRLRRELDARLGWYIGIGTIPIGVAGLAFEDSIETSLRSLYVIGAALIGLGLLLLLAERTGTRRRQVEDVTLRDAVVVGAAQALALIPGSSRSGTTITAGLFLGLDRAAAARFSFLLSIPAVVLSGLYQLPAAVGESTAGVVPTLVGIVVSFVSGYAAIAGLLRFLANNSTMVFVVYRVVLGLLVIGLVAGGVLEANAGAA